MKPVAAFTLWFLALLPLPALAQNAVEQHLLVKTEVDVGSDGQITDVRLATPYHPLLDGKIKEQVRRTRFEPVIVDGAPATVTTHMSFGACVRGNDDQIDVALDYIGHGPRGTAAVRLPRVASELIRSGISKIELKLAYRIDGDGRGHLGEVDWTVIPQSARREIRQQYQRWIEDQRYLPERVNGVPVASTVEMPITFEVTRGLGKRKQVTLPAAASACERAREALPAAPVVLAGPLRLREGAVQAGEG